MLTALTNKEVDNRLKPKNIKRIDTYVNKRTPINFQCLICNYIWKVTPQGIIIHGTGCPRCAGQERLTNEIIDKRIKDRKLNARRVGNYITGGKTVEVQCLVKECGHIWRIYPAGILFGNSGCPKCAGNAKLSKQEINEKLKPRKIELLGEYKNSSVLSEFKCLSDNCEYVWRTRLNSITSQGSGCPRCAGQVLTNKDIDLRLKDRNILRIGNYTGAFKKIEFKCLIDGCNHVWLGATHEIIDKGQGCPLCWAGTNEKLIFEIFKKSNLDFKYHHKFSNINNYELDVVVDFYIPHINLIIEYNGDQHYRPVRFGGMSQTKAEVQFKKQIKRDQALEYYCKNNNIKLIWIDTREYKYLKLENYLKETLLPMIQSLLK